MTNQTVYQIFIVEDHPAIQAAYRRIIDDEPDLEVCGVVPGGGEALLAISNDAPDLVTVDISLPDMDGLDLVRQLRYLLPDLPILVVSGRQASLHADRAIRSGATGFVDKMDAATTLVSSIRHALEGMSR